jgi:hypothetical protein
MYLGKEEGEPWVAEASMPHGKDPQVRRLKLDDERFKLADKNQYLIFRNTDSESANEAAELAKKFAVKMLPENQEIKNEGIGEKLYAFKYNFIEAARSLWHSQKFDYFAKQRLFKYFADYHNNVPFQYIFAKRNFFCSEFVLLCCQLAELKKNKSFTHLIEKNPPPQSSENKYRGFLKLIARICYVFKRAFWCRYMAIKYSRAMDKIIKTKLDFLRSTPQDVVNYMMREDPDHYRPMFMVNKAS